MLAQPVAMSVMRVTGGALDWGIGLDRDLERPGMALAELGALPCTLLSVTMSATFGPRRPSGHEHDILVQRRKPL